MTVLTSLRIQLLFALGRSDIVIQLVYLFFIMTFHCFYDLQSVIDLFHSVLFLIFLLSHDNIAFTPLYSIHKGSQNVENVEY